MNIFFFLIIISLIFFPTSLIIAQSTTTTTESSTTTTTGGSTITTTESSTTTTTGGSTITTTGGSTTTTNGGSTTTTIGGSTTTTTSGPSCLNGGLLIDNSNCLCQGLFEGPKCETLKCVSGGYLDSTTQRCICPKGYIGLHCEGFIKHPKPQNIFKSSQPTFNVFIFEDSTVYYGKMGLKIFKEVMVNHVMGNENNYNSYLVSYNYSNNSNGFTSKNFGKSSDFVNYINNTISPQQSTSYQCYTVNMFQNIIKLIKDNKIQNSPFVIYTQHPPNDYEIYKDELEYLAIAFKIRFTILLQNDLLLNGCDETDDAIKISFSALRDLAFLTGGIFYQLNADDPQSGIQHSFDILYNPQMVSFSMKDDCSSGVSLNYQSDLFILSGHIIIQSDTPIDMTKQINPSFKIISYSYDNKTITLSSSQMSPTKPGNDVLNIQNIPGKCSIQLLSLYPSQQSQYGIDIYYSYIPSNVVDKDGHDSAYLFMKEGTQNVINFNVQRQNFLQKISYTSDKNDVKVTKGSFTTQNENVNFLNVVNKGNTIFGYTLGDNTNTFTCQGNKKFWFIIVVEISLYGRTLYYQRYLPVKCLVPIPVTTTIIPESTTEFLSTQSSFPSTISPTSSSQETTLLSTTPVPPTRTATFGLVASCGVDYSIAMPYLNGIASLKQTYLSETFYNSGYLYFSDSNNSTLIPQYYNSFSSFIDDVRTFQQHCNPTTVTTYVELINRALKIIKDDKFQKNSPLVLFPVSGPILTPTSKSLIRPLIEYAVAKRISIFVFSQYNSPQFKSNDIFSQLVKATNGHMFFLNHVLRYPDNSYFVQNTIADFFTNIYPNTLIQSRSITNDYGVDNYGKIITTEEKDIIVSISSDILSAYPTNGYILRVKMIDKQGSVIMQSLNSFNNSNIVDEYSNYEYVIFKNLPPNEYTISVQALIYPLSQISVRIWERIDIYNNNNFIDISYLSISNKQLSSEIPNGPNNDNGMVMSADIFTKDDVSDISFVTYNTYQLTSGVATNDVFITPINSINFATIKKLSSTKIQAIFNPIIDLTATNSKYFVNTTYDWPIYKTDLTIYFNNSKQQTYTFNNFMQGDYNDFIPNIDYQKFIQGKNDQFYYCENKGYLTYDIISNEFKCNCLNNDYYGNSCENVNKCQSLTNYPGKDDNTYRILSFVLATTNSPDSFYKSTMDLVNSLTQADVSNIWQFRLYYYYNQSIISHYIGNDFSAFQESFKFVIQNNPSNDYVCVSDIKNVLYDYLPSTVKGLVWLVTDEGITLPTVTPSTVMTSPSTETTTFSSTTSIPPIDYNCPDDITNGYNQDLFYIYHDNNNDDYFEKNGKYIFNGGAPLKFDSSGDYKDISYVLLQKLLSGDISINNHLEELTSNFMVNIEQSKEAFVLILGQIDSTLTNPTTPLITSKFVSLYTVKDKDTLQSTSPNDLSFTTTYVINGLKVNVAYLRNNLIDEPSTIPVIGNITYALYLPQSIQDVELIGDKTNTYKTERNGCSYKYSFTQQQVTDVQDKLKFTFKNLNNESYTKVYPNNQVYNSFKNLINQSDLSITCRNGKYTLNTDTQALNLYYCLCNENFRGIDCSIPICQNEGKLNGMQNACDCSGTNYYGEFCQNIVL